jgi:aryl-alcohol dehydrogenase-like predicted oxidoreductase
VEKRRLGRSGLRISRLALGTMTWGKDTDDDAAAALLTAFIDAGGTLVDTADVYSGGIAERMLGRLLSGVVSRENVLVATKAVAHRHDGPFGAGASRGALTSALDSSLRRLGIDHIDLWQLHAWDPSVPIEETMAVVDVAVTSGKVRYGGVSNYCGWQLATAVRTATVPLVTNQVEYSLVERGVEREVVPAAAAHGVGVLCWAPLGRGVLTGKYRTTTPAGSRGAGSHLAAYVDQHRTERADRVVHAVCTAAEGLGTTPSAVALSWVRDRPEVTAAVVGARDVGQLRASLDAETLDLPEEIRSALDDVSDIELGYPERHLHCKPRVTGRR